MPHLPRPALPSNLPKISIKVEPYDGWRKKWKYTVYESFDGGESWCYVFGFGYKPMSGYAKIQDECLIKGRKSAAEYCERILAKKAKDNAHDNKVIWEDVTCQDEPV